MQATARADIGEQVWQSIVTTLQNHLPYISPWYGYALAIALVIVALTAIAWYFSWFRGPAGVAFVAGLAWLWGNWVGENQRKEYERRQRELEKPKEQPSRTRDSWWR